MSEAKQIDCVFSTDDNYCQHLGVAIASVSQNNLNHAISAHIIHHGVSDGNFRRLEDHVRKLPNVTATFYEFDPSPYQHFRLDGHISLASYFRLFLTEILPKTVERVIYLDADTVILGDISELWALDLEGALIGAAMDPYANNPATMEQVSGGLPISNIRLGLPEDHVYFNAGILIIDLSAWRAAGLLAKFVAYVEQNHQILRFHDQDTLNAVLTGRVKYLPYDWNFQAKTRYEDLASSGIPLTEFEAMARRPKAVHYTSARKPWFYMHQVRYEDLYWRYLRKTPWRDYVPPDRTLRRQLGRKLPLVRQLYRKLRPIRG